MARFSVFISQIAYTGIDRYARLLLRSMSSRKRTGVYFEGLGAPVPR
jgi:hypothetical protein